MFLVLCYWYSKCRESTLLLIEIRITRYLTTRTVTEVILLQV